MLTVSQLLLANLAPPCADPMTAEQDSGRLSALETYTARFFTRTTANYGRLHALHEICGRRVGASSQPTSLVPTSAAERRMEMLLSQLNRHLQVFRTSDWDDLVERIREVQLRLAGNGRELAEDTWSKLPKLGKMRGRSPIGAGDQGTSLGWCPSCGGATNNGSCAFPAGCEDSDESPVELETLLDFFSLGSSKPSRILE